MVLLIGLLLLAAPVPSQTVSPDLLSRVAEEADALRQNAPKCLTRETLEQRTLLPPARFRPRIGGAVTSPAQPHLRVREIVSEYTVGALGKPPSEALVEFREVVSVDGAQVRSAADARHALSLGVTSPDDQVRKRMLEDFARHGLVDIGTDFGLILLEFTKLGQARLEIRPAGSERIGPDDALALSWRQVSGEGAAIEFLGRKAARRSLEGILYVRQSDQLPLRIKAWTEHMESGRRVRDEATVDYAQTSHGFVAPASVVHRHLIDGRMWTENLFRYEPFKQFSAEAEIKFTEVPEPPK